MIRRAGPRSRARSTPGSRPCASRRTRFGRTCRRSPTRSRRSSGCPRRSTPAGPRSPDGASSSRAAASTRARRSSRAWRRPAPRRRARPKPPPPPPARPPDRRPRASHRCASRPRSRRGPCALARGRRRTDPHLWRGHRIERGRRRARPRPSGRPCRGRRASAPRGHPGWRRARAAPGAGRRWTGGRDRRDRDRPLRPERAARDPGARVPRPAGPRGRPRPARGRPCSRRGRARAVAAPWPPRSRAAPLLQRGSGGVPAVARAGARSVLRRYRHLSEEPRVARRRGRRGRAADRDRRAIPRPATAAWPAQRARVRRRHVRRGRRCPRRHGRRARGAHGGGRARAVRGPLVIRLVLAALLVVATACSADTPRSRVDRAVEAMAHLRGVRFSLVATTRATGQAPSGGELRTTLRATGELVPPDRLRLTVDAGGGTVELVLIGERAWRDGRLVAVGAERSFDRPLELLERLGPGEEVDGAARGSIEVELGLFDDLIRRQTFTVSEPVEGDGSGLDTVATTYVIEYWDFDTALEVR